MNQVFALFLPNFQSLMYNAEAIPNTGNMYVW